tara:strand:- start:45 stop:1304 length:1260 start_codon:yes stop_codon:yes gene_type:complete
MANTDTIIANGTGQTVREDIQTNLQALKSNNSSSTDPSGSTLTAYMSFADTGDGIYKIHNGTTFQSVLDISGASSAGTHIAAPGTSSIPGYRFLNSSGTPLQSGMGLPTDTRLGFFHGGSEKLSILNGGAVGIGTTAPSNTLTVLGGQTLYTTNTDAALSIEALNSSSTDDAFIDLVADTTYQDYGLRIRRNGVSGGNGSSEILHRGTGNLDIGGSEAFNIRLITNAVSRFQISAVGSLRADHSTVTSGANNTETGTFQGRGFGCRTGLTTDNGNIINGQYATSVNTGHHFNIWWSDTAAYFYIDSVRLGYLMLGTSDYRKKRNIENLDINGIERVKKLRPVKYQDKAFQIFKETEDIHEGFIAHEMQEVIPDAVKEEKDKGIQSIDYLPVLSTLTKALQEAVAKIEVLEAKVAALEAG